MIYVHNDPSGWGKQIVMAAGRSGTKAKLFKSASEVPTGARAFVRLDQVKDQRAKSKTMISQLCANGVTTLPSAQEAIWYDDKIAQADALKDHMPETRIVTDRDEAIALADKMTFPFISKSSEGSASRGVRLIKNRKEARREVMAAFGSGIQTGVYDRIQRGYVYWQDFMDGNENDIRVIVCGAMFFGLIRGNRKNVPFASGSGIVSPVTELDEKTRMAFEKAAQVAKELNTVWMAFDIVFKDDKPYILEMSSSWTPHSYYNCPAFSIDGSDEFVQVDGVTGGHFFDIAVAIMGEI